MVKHLTLATVETYCHSYRVQIYEMGMRFTSALLKKCVTHDFAALVDLQESGMGLQGGKIPTMDAALRQITRGVDVNLRSFKLEPLIMSPVAAPSAPTRAPTPAPPPYAVATGKGQKVKQDDVLQLLKESRKKGEGLQREKKEAARTKAAGNPLGFKGAVAAGRAARVVYERMGKTKENPLGGNSGNL